ncbi:MAG: monofunctional biosynthetic peptidoglycan transglycosylase [Bacteroidetes bacterium]|nr:monofunctional biosynthetic peptidoglycan transglycosylase [Bacteroidota bacterium]
MLRKVWCFIWKALLYFLVFTIALVIVFRFVPVPFTFLMLQRCVEQKMDGKEMRLDKDWTSIAKISNHLQLAVVASEDQNFLFHYGFDLDAIGKAVKHNEKQQKRKHPRIHGASTISQQCAKNVFLWQGRNFIRKGLEVYFTGLIELLWSKERIMEVYLNVIEMGDGIYGAEAASEYYFHRPAAELNSAQAALLAVCLPNPRKFNPAHPSGYVLKRQIFILTQMNQLGGQLDYKQKEE